MSGGQGSGAAPSVTPITAGRDPGINRAVNFSVMPKTVWNFRKEEVWTYPDVRVGLRDMWLRKRHMLMNAAFPAILVDHSVAN